MSKRSNTWQKATALIPLALLSGAWTASLAVSSATATDEQAGSTLPDGTALPTQAVDAPASVSSPGEIAPGVPVGSAAQVVSSASTNGIPAVALAAYQRAAQVINGADPACNIEWPLIAAIGRVESDHGRYGGNILSDDGVATPGIYGIPLDGTNGTRRITDTDAGQYDNDRVFDRAVGPMQFIPSTWSVVGVDGDGDGKRDPQNINDAALAAAVYLCSGDEDLSTEKGLDAAVFRYNNSSAYVDLVKQIAAAYADGEFMSVPTSAYAPSTFDMAYDDSVFDFGTRGDFGKTKGPKNTNSNNQGTGNQNTGGTGAETPAEQPAPAPTSPGSGTKPGTKSPGDTVKDVITKVPETVQETLTELEKATKYCSDNLTKAELDLLGGLSKCAEAYLDGGVNAVTKLLDGLLGGVVGGLLGN